MEVNEVYSESSRKKLSKPIWAEGKPSKERVPKEEEIVQKILSVAQIDLEASAYLSLLYLTGSRVEEITPYTYKGKEYQLGNILLKKHGVRLKDIFGEEDKDGRQWIKIITRVEKTFKAKKDMPVEDRLKKLEKTTYKKQRFPYDESFPCFPLLKVIESYIEQFKEPDKEIVCIVTKTLQRYCQKYLDLNPHMIRHWRCKILVREYGFTPQDLKKFIGWGSFAMPMYYSESEQEIIDKKFITY